MIAAGPASDVLPAVYGTYGFVLHLAQPIQCAIGALGTWAFPPGGYLYVGSAWGPGGLRARVLRHMRGAQNPHWHLDYLRPHTVPMAVWVAPGAHLECKWARYLAQTADAEIIVPRFGASDCRCSTHLFHLRTEWRTLDLPGAPDLLTLCANES